ncbi:MAG: phosphoesterase RecJ-like protein [Planctomycetota bacterium]|jgi:phosphoesterase RecJ-like protein
MKTQASAESVASQILACERIILTTHMTPDGDGLGSELALLRHLRRIGKNAIILNCSTVPEDLRFLVRSGEVVTFQRGKHENLLEEADVICAFDLGAAGRLGRMEGPVREATCSKVLVDHHLFDNDLFDVLYVDTEASSSAELTFGLLEAMGMEKLEVEVAEPLHVGLIQDTGSFNFNTTTPSALRLAAKFIEAGVKPYRIWRKLNCQKPLHRVRFMGNNIARIELHENGKLSSALCDLEYMKKVKGEPRDAFEVVNHLLSIRGVEVGCFAVQIGSEKTKFSLRSSGRIDVCDLAKKFGGGGHRFAAGFTVDGMSAKKAFAEVLEECFELVSPGALR